MKQHESITCYLFPRAAITKYHKFGGSTQQKPVLIILEMRSLESWVSRPITEGRDSEDSCLLLVTPTCPMRCSPALCPQETVTGPCSLCLQSPSACLRTCHRFRTHLRSWTIMSQDPWSNESVPKWCMHRLKGQDADMTLLGTWISPLRPDSTLALPFSVFTAWFQFISWRS